MIKAVLVGVITALVFMVTGYGQTPTRAELLQTIKHIETLAQETQQELDAEKQAHAQAKAALGAAQQATADTQNQFNAYQKAAETEIQKGNAAITSLAKLVKKHHLDLIILVGLWLCLCGAVYLKAGMGLGPVGIYAAIGIAAAGVGFISWRL